MLRKAQRRGCSRHVFIGDFIKPGMILPNLYICHFFHQTKEKVHVALTAPCVPGFTEHPPEVQSNLQKMLQLLLTSRKKGFPGPMKSDHSNPTHLYEIGAQEPPPDFFNQDRNQEFANGWMTDRPSFSPIRTPSRQ